MVTQAAGQYLVGTSGWTYDHWKGIFYPEHLAKHRWFEYYASLFPTVEINATFYRTFKDQTYLNWRQRAPAGFRYVLKAPKTITHRKFLDDVADDVKAFWRSACLLDDRLGMVLLQLAPSTPYDLDRLRQALLAFGDPSRVAVEFRHSRWLTDETRQLLSDLGAAFCNVDSPRHHLTDWVTSSLGYIRLHGRKRWYAYNYSEAELEQIADTARCMTRSGAQVVYIFFNNDFEGYAPQNALYLGKQLSREDAPTFGHQM